MLSTTRYDWIIMPRSSSLRRRLPSSKNTLSTVNEVIHPQLRWRSLISVWAVVLRTDVPTVAVLIYYRTLLKDWPLANCSFDVWFATFDDGRLWDHFAVWLILNLLKAILVLNDTTNSVSDEKINSLIDHAVNVANCAKWRFRQLLKVADIQISNNVAQVMLHDFLNVKGQNLKCNTILRIAIDDVLHNFLEILNVDLVVLPKRSQSFCVFFLIP